MKKKNLNIVKLETGQEGFILTNTDGGVGLMFDRDQDYLCTIFDADLTTLKDIALFMEWNPDNPNTYLSRKYNIIDDTDIFVSVRKLTAWFDVLYDIGVINEYVEVDFKLPLEQALLELI